MSLKQIFIACPIPKRQIHQRANFRPKKPADNFWATRGKRGGDMTGEVEEEGGVQAMLEQEQE